MSRLSTWSGASKADPIPAFMQEFFSRTGNTKLKFKPAFNPYTEVSIHAFTYEYDTRRRICQIHVFAADG